MLPDIPPWTFAVLFTVVMTIAAIYKLDKGLKVYKLFKRKTWLVNFIIIAGFSAYVMSLQGHDEETEKVKDAARKGMLAFIIALMAHLELTIAPFWIVFVLAYYLQGYV